MQPVQLLTQALSKNNGVRLWEKKYYKNQKSYYQKSKLMPQIFHDRSITTGKGILVLTIMEIYMVTKQTKSEKISERYTLIIYCIVW